MTLLIYVVLLFHQWRIDKYPALFFLGVGTFCNEAFDQRLYSLGTPGGSSGEALGDFIGIDGGIFPDNFHDFKFSFGNLGQRIHGVPPSLELLFGFFSVNDKTHGVCSPATVRNCRQAYFRGLQAQILKENSIQAVVIILPCMAQNRVETGAAAFDNL